MRIPLLASLVLALGLSVATARTETNPEIVSLGHDTYALTHWAGNGWTRNTEKLKDLALQDAAAYCAKLHKELKVLSTETDRPAIPLTGFANAKVVFKALDAGDPELHAPVAASPMLGSYAPAVAPEPPAPRTPTDTLYSDLMKLDDLRKRGILSDDEFQAQKKKLLEKAN